MKDKSNSTPFESAETLVTRAVEAILAEPLSTDSLERTLAQVRKWDLPPAAAPGGMRSRRMALAVAALVAFVTTAPLALWLLSAYRRDRAPNPLREGGQRVAVAPVVNQGAPSVQQASFFKLSPMTHAVVSPGATVFVTTGPEHPVRLGETVTRTELLKGIPEGSRRLHVWDWTRSDRSRVVIVPKASGRAALSPDGTVLLYASGTAIDLATSKARSVGGFETRAGQHIWPKLRYSPTGRYVLAWILNDTEPKTTRLRVVDMRTGRIAGEFDAGSYARFLPDEASLIYSRPHDQIPRRDIVSRRSLATGELTVDFEPVLGAAELQRAQSTYGTFETVGMAVSSDGSLVAVGYCYGQVSVWETRSGQQVSRTVLRRADGTRDTFFGAELLRFSPGNTFLAIASKSRLKIIETQTGKVLSSHYHRATPIFAHLQWDGLKQVTLLSDSRIGRVEPGPGPYRTEMVTADILPRLYIWKWQEGDPVVKEYREEDG